MSFPYLAKTTLKYKSPHATDLSFAKDETIRVTGPSEDDEDWLIGESLDGSKSGGFPKDFIVAIEETESSQQPQSEAATIKIQEPVQPESEISKEAEQAPPPVSINEPVPPSPKLDPQSRLPTPAIAPTPAPPTPVSASPAIHSTPTVPDTLAPSAPAPTQPTAGTGDSPPRPQSMKDRLAFFASAAQNKAPPPPIKPKPQTGGLTWSQRQKLRQEQEAKERENAPPTQQAQSTPTSINPEPISQQAATSAPASNLVEEKKDEGKGMSAADALSSITKGGSLKERMAALQGQGAFGGGSNNDEEKKSIPASTGKVWKRPPAPPQPEPEPEVENTTEGTQLADQAEKVKSPITEEGDSLAQAGSQEEPQEGEEDEEQQEKARRAAIAARMAKLGARGPMGMMPPAKPVRKPTKESISSETQTEATPNSPAPDTAKDDEEGKRTAVSPEVVSPPAGTNEATPAEVSSTAAPPKSIPIAAMPRRTAPPRRRGPAASNTAAATSTTSPEVVRENPVEPEMRFETTDENGAPIPPPQVMIAGEEDVLPKTEIGKQKEKEAEEVGKGIGGLEGAAAAGIALAPVDPIGTTQPKEEKLNKPLEPELPEERDEPLVGAIGGADSLSRGTGAVLAEGEGDIIDKSAPVQEVDEGIVEGGDEKDDILKEAQQGHLNFELSNDPLDEDIPTPLSPVPIGMVPLHPPASDGSDYDEDEPDAPPPPPRRPRGFSMDNIPLDEVELKHEHEHTHDNSQAIDDEVPPPLPSQRRVSMEKPAGPRPLPSPGREGRALPPPPVGSSLIPPREDSDDEVEEEEDFPPPPPARSQQPPTSQTQPAEDEEEDVPPPPPPGRHIPPPRDTGFEEEEEEEEEDVPPPLPSARHQPPAPAQGPESEEEDSAPPPPPARLPPASIQAQNEEQASPPPPPTRKPSLPAPLQIGIPTPASGPKSPPVTSPVISSSPARSRAPAATEDTPSSPKEEDEDATRRSGIAARMAKLGGIKFGMPPPTFKKPSQNVASPTTEAPSIDEPHVDSPIDKEPPLPSPRAEQPTSPIRATAQEEGDETPEQEAARRRATLARLRAGGALGGFGLFNQGGPAEVEDAKEDTRGLQAEKAAVTEKEEDEEDAPPPPPAARPSVPTGPPVLGAPAAVQQGEEDSAPPPPPARPTISTAPTIDAPPPKVSQTPTSPIPPSPVRTPSGRRPPIPTEKRYSSTHKRTSTSSSAIIPEDRPTSIASDWQISSEPAIMLSNQFENEQEESNEAPPPPPPNRPPPPPLQTQSSEIPPQSPIRETPRRSGSLLSRKSRNSIDIPPSSPRMYQPQQQEIPPSPVQGSLARQPSQSQNLGQGQGGRPGFDQLKEASQTYGAQLARSAHNLFSQGRRAQVGDGSSAGFVLQAIDQAKLPRPNQGWGQIVFEQEGGSILKKYDAPRPGDIAAFYDSKLKGKKGLTTYNQHVGSVQEPLIGVVAEFEERKHKLRILQVERGVPEEVSYRCEDLKSGKIIVYRAGL